MPSLNASRSAASLGDTRGLQRGMSRSRFSLGDEDDDGKAIAHRVLYDGGQVILIKPTVDASDKELHRRNEMPNEVKFLKKYLDAEGFPADDNRYFVPKRLGQFSKDTQGTKLNVVDQKKEHMEFDQTVKPEAVDDLLQRLKRVQEKDIQRAVAQNKTGSAGGNQTEKFLSMLQEEKDDEWHVVRP